MKKINWRELRLFYPNLHQAASFIHVIESLPNCAEYLNKHGIQSTHYHAGLSQDERIDHENLWKSDQVPVICATNAFGMGIDKPDVRYVIHLDLPNSMEAYFQEAGRAGRGRSALLRDRFHRIHG